MTKIIQFFMEVRAELLKVVWPSRNETIKYTGIVAAFSLALAAILSVADYGLVQLLAKIVNK